MKQQLDLAELIEKYEEQEHITRYEGETGVRNLCRLVRALGYKDPRHFGQFQGASYGDLIEFLEDNPGCVNGIVDWITEQVAAEWAENLEAELLDEQSDDDAEEEA